VYTICAENCLEKFRGTRDEVCLIAVYPQPNSTEICQETRLLTSDKIRTIASNLHLNCAEYQLQTLLTPRQRSRVLALDNTAHDSLQVM